MVDARVQGQSFWQTYGAAFGVRDPARELELSRAWQDPTGGKQALYIFTSDGSQRKLLLEVGEAGLKIAAGEGAKAALSAFDHLIRHSAPANAALAPTDLKQAA